MLRRCYDHIARQMGEQNLSETDNFFCCKFYHHIPKLLRPLRRVDFANVSDIPIPRPRIELQIKRRLKVFDVFAGCGGLSIGLQNAGMEIGWAIEKDPDCVTTYRETHPTTNVFCEDVEDVLDRLLAGTDPRLPKPGEVDVLCGGPPCQGYSVMNAHRSIDDPRNRQVWFFILQEWILMVNVS